MVTFCKIEKIEILLLQHLLLYNHLPTLQANMTSMMINSSVERAILVMVTQEQERIVKVLAQKYGFDEAEALGSLEAVSSVEKKEVTPRKPKEDKPVKAKPEPKGKGKAKKEESDEPKAKKAKTGYLLFCDAARASAKAKLEREAEETGGEKVMAKHVVTLLAACWKDLDEEQQAVWKARAEAIKEGRGDELDEVEVELEAEEEDDE